VKSADYLALHNEALVEPPEVRAEKCCAIQHPTNWTASTGEQFTITQPVVKDGAIYLIVNVERDGETIHSDEHYMPGMTDVVTVPRGESYRDWVVALQNRIEQVTL